MADWESWNPVSGGVRFRQGGVPCIDRGGNIHAGDMQALSRTGYGRAGARPFRTEERAVQMSYVRNIATAPDETCSCPGCKSWLDHWERKTRRTALICGATDCRKRAELGCHVRLSGNPVSRYVVPLCKNCSQRTDEFYVDKELVSADCEKAYQW